MVIKLLFILRIGHCPLQFGSAVSWRYAHSNKLINCACSYIARTGFRPPPPQLACSTNNANVHSQIEKCTKCDRDGPIVVCRSQFSDGGGNRSFPSRSPGSNHSDPWSRVIRTASDDSCGTTPDVLSSGPMKNVRVR